MGDALQVYLSSSAAAPHPSEHSFLLRPWSCSVASGSALLSPPAVLVAVHGFPATSLQTNVTVRKPTIYFSFTVMKIPLNHRIIQVGKDPPRSQVQPHPTVPTDRIPQCHISMVWNTYRDGDPPPTPWAAVPVPNCSFRDEIIPCI